MKISIKSIKTSLVIAGAFAGAVITYNPVLAFAEIREQNCPFSCKTENIDKSFCRDWAENGRCYIEDLRADSGARGQLNAPIQDSNSFNPDLGRQIITVNKRISAGQTERVEIMSRSIDRIDVVLRREGVSTQTQLRANIGTSRELGQQQVDQNISHVLSYSVQNVSRPGESLELTALEGDVYIESVHMMYRK